MSQMLVIKLDNNNKIITINSLTYNRYVKSLLLEMSVFLNV